MLVGALVVAAITAFMARSLISGSSAPQAQAQMAPPVVGTEVLVATKTLPVGTILDATSFKYQPWPNQMVSGAYFVRKDGFDIKTLQGTVVRTVITAGQPLTQGVSGQAGRSRLPGRGTDAGHARRDVPGRKQEFGRRLRVSR